MEHKPQETSLVLLYDKEDIDKVRRLHTKLKQAKCNPWIKEEDILGGQKRDFEIKNAINSKDFALICLARNSVNKQTYLNKEIKWVLDRQKKMNEGSIFLIPVKLEECDLPDCFFEFQPVDLYTSGDGFERLLKVLKQRTGPDIETIEISGPNPFHYGGAVPVNLFHGRKDTLQAILTRIGGPSLQSISIIGERSIGKSSLLMYVKSELVNQLPTNYKYLIVYLDLMIGYCHTRKGLMHALRDELTRVWREPWLEDKDGDLETFDFEEKTFALEWGHQVFCFLFSLHHPSVLVPHCRSYLFCCRH